jgi:ABC-type multidrug transport system ATPase subunit
MKISLQDAGKRYNREWIFRHLTYEFSPGIKYAITGANGSGKSTLLQVIGGVVLQNEGQVVFQTATQPIAIPEPYKQLSVAAPYLELIEEMTATEFLIFHSKFKTLTKDTQAILEEMELGAAASKQIRYFSSGMKQRLKLAQAFFCDVPVLLLDEPTTNLDAEGIALYQHLIEDHTHNKLVIVSSNDQQEYHFCEDILKIADYK